MKISLKKEKKKQSIPKNVRIIIWNHYIGEDIIKHKCLCCKKVTISNTNFEVGHVLSEKNGGTHEINNLRPICFSCNHSMGAENMIDFVVKYGWNIFFTTSSGMPAPLSATVIRACPSCMDIETLIRPSVPCGIACFAFSSKLVNTRSNWL